MTSQTQSQRMLDLDLDLEQVDLDLDLLEFLILQPEQNQDLGLLFKVCNMRPTNRDARLQKMMQIRPLFTSTLINSKMRPQSEARSNASTAKP